MLAFLIPVKSRKTAKSWPVLCRLFERTVRSVCRQTSQNFTVLVVCNETPQISFSHPNLEFLNVDYPTPSPDLESKNVDKERKIITGLVALRNVQPTHVMFVDSDDCVSRHLADYVDGRSQQNGWFFESGYEYDDGSDRILNKSNRFYSICGSCNIVRYQLYGVPEQLPPYHEINDYDRFIGGHHVAQSELAERGTPLEPLPFPGAVYIRDGYGENMSTQEPWSEKFRRSPREALRGFKKRLVAPFQQQRLTRDIVDEFGLYSLA